ncbi:MULTISPECIES: hypothetical protein [Erwinia]|uniref:Uncharacterized protein n=1 Tax=Erwinia rhapontici TaxID=55212 RepID=A0ABM7N7C7_ERWRD|nr:MULTISPECIES: hypothetical protein [Erwinia]NNS09700.1 hypothetical protein [Erwinia sp. JH02]BCQ37386.1 hypothetical protein ERHA53_47290 [Erwinia rhapontici]
MGNTHRLYTTALVGFGPANLGLLLSAYRKNKLSEIAKNGIAIFEKSPRLGAGKLGYYQITANSLSSVFLECIDDPRFYELTSDFIGGDALTFLRDYPDTAPQLSLVADLLERLAEKIISRLAEKYQITLYREAEVTQIKRSGKSFSISFNHNGNIATAESEFVFANCGGYQTAEQSLLNDIAPVAVTSDEFLSIDKDDASALLHRHKIQRVAIIGGSHSAISSVIRLSEIADNASLAITIYCRSLPRLYFETAAAAQDEGYAFDPVADVCPLSGRINRFAGLRYDSHQAALSIFRTGSVSPQSPAVNFIVSDNPFITASNSSNQELCILATGYRSASPVTGLSGKDTDGRVRDIAGNPVPGLYSFGLGAGLSPSEKAGGEPSFKGRLDGVWLYINDVGDVIIDAYTEDQHIPENIATGR